MTAILAGYRRLRRIARRWLGETAHAHAVEPPDRPKPLLYVVGDRGNFWCAVLVCPCGCGDTIRLSLVKNDHPAWRLTVDADDRPSLSPSIDRTVRCRSHFFLRGGAVIWAERHNRTT